MIGYLLRRQSEVPSGDAWLTAAERRWLDPRRSAKRIADWRLGRWTAKAAVTAFCERRQRPRPGELEILAADDGAPEPFAGGRPLALSLALSHSQGRALCCVARAGVRLGCDLELVEPRSSEFVASYLTPAERAALATADAASRDLLANLVWSAKESALKALRHGLRADTRSVEVEVAAGASPGWGRLVVASRDAGVLAGHWRRIDTLLATIVCWPASDEIIDLDDR